MPDGPRRRGLVIGVGSFRASAPLEFAEERAREVGEAPGGVLAVRLVSHGFR